MPATRMTRALRGAALALSTFLAASSALAQTPGVALDRFDPAPAGDRMFGVPSPYVAGDLTPHAMILMDYAHNPLVLRTVPNNGQVGAVVADQLVLNADIGLALWSRLFVDVDLPIVPYQTGDNPSGLGQVFTSPKGAALGDLRIGARVRLWGEYFDPFQIAVGGYLWVPTGARGGFVSTGQARGLPQVIVGGRVIDRIVYSAALGALIQGDVSYAGVGQGTMFKWGLGAGALLLDDRSLQLGAELSGDVTPRDVEKASTNAELLLDVRYRFLHDFEVAGGAGPGLSRGIGTPAARAILSIAYTPEQIRDRDHDGIADEVDACPDQKGVADPDPKKNGCPPIVDRDGDGIADVDDACPDVKGVADPDPKKNGCPPDRDGDGIPDADDACPDVKGVASSDPKKNGCPVVKDRDGDGIPDGEDACPDVKGIATDDPKTNGCPPPPADRDGDGIPDVEDACPDVKGVADPDPKKNGCPKTVEITGNEIVIHDEVQFDVDKAIIKPVSNALIDEVAAIMKAHPEILRVEVQGHTDNTGSAAHNKVLSGARADAVAKALAKRGVAPKRLTSRGYGQEKPIADNSTEDGRHKNRRVQFAILESKPKGNR
jgi:outer membrane protein OmpA-like peptidoglycan-associated protein